MEKTWLISLVCNSILACCFLQVFAGDDEDTGEPIQLENEKGFTGSEPPPLLLFSNTGSFFVKFNSDASSSDLGFSVVFSIGRFHKMEGLIITCTTVINKLYIKSNRLEIYTMLICKKTK